MELGELEPHLHPELGVEVGERLVEEEDLGVAHERAADRDPLALAAGELRRLAVHQRVELQEGRDLVGLLGDLALRGAGDIEAEADVLPHGHVRVERVGLEDHRDLPPRRRHAGDVAAGDGRPGRR